MAASWMRSASGIGSAGKQVIGHRISNSSAALSPAVGWNSMLHVHSSAYDKNEEGSVAAGEDEQMTFQQPQQLKPLKEEGKYHYWEPHPQTGVFGPASAAASTDTPSSAGKGTSTADVLEENAWFRPTSLEDLEKPHPIN